jgi:predicted  nucleic acid-binding Zn-ribbon protein
VSHPLEPLFALQKKDLKLIRILREVQDIPKRRGDIEAQLSGAKKKLETAIDSRKHTEASLHDIENEIGLLNERVIKYKQQQMEADSNEQYRAFVKEIGTVESEIKEREEKQLSLMEALEQGKTIEQKCREQLGSEEGSIADEILELDERLSELSERADRMKADRRRVAENCDRSLLQKYSRILNNKKDAAIVFVESGGHCGGCHMKLPPQVINDARNPAKVVGCNFCGRIVYNPASDR